MEILRLQFSCHCPLANTARLICQLNYSAISSQPPLQNSGEVVAPAVLVITSRHGSYTKHLFPIVAFVSVAVETCLLSRFPETGYVTPLIKNSLPQQGASFRDRYLATGLYATIFIP
jgi:hypothetical protein